MDWRAKLDLELRSSLNKLLRKIKHQEGAYKKALNPRDAQIWTAMAEINLKLERIERRIKELEKSKRKIKGEVKRALESY